MNIRIQYPLEGANGPFILDITLNIPRGSFCSLFGQSGAGKTTLLRLLAGLETPKEGYIDFDNDVWLDTSKNIYLPPNKRLIGYVFQDYALFPHLSVKENLLYASPDFQKADELCSLLGINELQGRKPSTLSGGQKQRVALARALMRHPKLLLLDEPLSALDPTLRTQIWNELEIIHRRYGTTTILVSHDISEVFRLCDTVHYLENGKVISSGSPLEVFGITPTSGKFSLPATVLAKTPYGALATLTLLAGGQIVRVMGTHEEYAELNVGDNVTIASKAFNPIVIKRD